MKYREIYDEYNSLVNRYVQIRLRLQLLPKGSLGKKCISNKTYHYLQYSLCGKKKTEYIREQDVEDIRYKLSVVKQLQEELETIRIDLSRLEQAVEILDSSLSRTFYFLRQCADMDAMPVAKRKDVLSFAVAMTALEGIPAQKGTDSNLNAWVKGEKAFADFYIPTLQRYGIMESIYEE